MPRAKKTKPKAIRLQPPKQSSRETQTATQQIAQQRTYTIVDRRLEKPTIELRQVRDGDSVCYEVSGNLNGPVPPIRDSNYLSKQQCIQIYRWMLLNRKMETALENLYKQGKVVGGVYFGLGQEACSCASACALKPDEWLGPMIRNQGALLVRGFSARDIMMQYMAKAGSPTGGRDASSHFGDIQKRNVVAPISTLGDLIPERARRGEGPTLIEAKMMRMKGHAIHDSAEYVPKALLEYWSKRDPVARFENYLVNVKKWLTRDQNEKLIASVDAELEADREFAVASPLPEPETAAGGAYCEGGCHEIKPKYGVPRVRAGKSSTTPHREAAVHLK